MEHFKLVFGSGTSSPAKIRPLKVWYLLDFPLGSALWNFASPHTKYKTNKGGGGYNAVVGGQTEEGFLSTQAVLIRGLLSLYVSSATR